MHKVWAALGTLFPQSQGFTVFGATAARLSRLYLPPVSLVINWPQKTGQIRAAGKGYYLFFAASVLLWTAVALLVGSLVSHVVQSPSVLEWVASGKGPEAMRPHEFVVFFQGRPLGPQVLAWGAVVAVLFGWRQWLGEPDVSCSFWRFLWPRAFVEFAALMSSMIFVFAVIMAAFPGLLEGNIPESRLPWQVWTLVVMALLAYRAATPINRRILEFTSGTTNSLCLPFVPCPILFNLRILAARLFAELPLHGVEQEGFSYPLYVRRKARYMKQMKAFYEREGLDTLDTDPTNPERRYFTASQRRALTKGYSEIVGLAEFYAQEAQTYRRWSRERAAQTATTE